MINYNPLLMIDFYKAVHSEQYPTGMSMIYSPGTPRMSRLHDVDEVVFFGAQAFCKSILIEAFNTYFFDRPLNEVVDEYNRILTRTLGKGTYNAQKIEDLHNLGYLPIAVFTVPEGVSTKIGVPQSVFINTHPNFAWLTNTLETVYSAFIWHIQISAEVGKRYRKIVDKYVAETCSSNVVPARMLGDFSMRGQHCPESAMTSSAAWLLSFLNTATVPAIMWLEDYYNCNIDEEDVGFGAISTEHSVMCSNYAIDGDEITHIKRLLTEVYPNNNFSMVSDSYDYWNLVTNLLPQCHKEIMEHNGTLLVRGDSGDPVEIIAGKPILDVSEWSIEELFVDEEYTRESFIEYLFDEGVDSDGVLYCRCKDKYFKVEFSAIVGKKRGGWTDCNYYFVDTFEIDWEEIEPNAELLGTVWALDQEFGHTVNEKGYKVLDPHVKAIYGDSITPQRCEEIYKRLAQLGYAANNVVLGVGSFSFMCLEEYKGENVNYKPYTRDTFGYAIKATYGEDEACEPVMIQKQPKAIAWKKSPKGCIVVAQDGQRYTDGYTFEEAHIEHNEDNLLQLIFKDSVMLQETSLWEIRQRMYPNGGF